MAAQRTDPDEVLATLPVEGQLPSFAGATQWLHVPALPEGALRGRVVLVNFCTFTCINWLRQLPYVRAWARAYADHGLVVIGVHTPEFAFEAEIGNVRRALRAMGVGYPVAVDNDFSVWDAFANLAWPALYLADAQGRIRRRHLGEGAYHETETAIRALLRQGGARLDSAPAVVEAEGIEVAADWTTLGSAETYTGLERARNFASPGGLVAGRRHTYAPPESLDVDQWAFAGEWAVESQRAVSGTGGQIAYQFHARDLHLVMAPETPDAGLRFQVSLDGQPPGTAHGLDVDSEGIGTLTEPRLYQLIRQSGPIHDATFEITFLDAGAGVYAFTFG
jgi:Thioredoxin like C-terminal domain/AhpC/TSA family